MIKLVIFDLDGTLVNAYGAVSSSVNHTLAVMGLPRKSHAEIKRSVGWGDRHLMTGFVGLQRADEALAIYRPHHAKALQKPGGVKFLPGVWPFLKGLKTQGYQLAIASNRPTKFTRIILKTLGMQKLFSIVLCGDKASRPKPHPDMLWAIAKRLKVKLVNVLYVGDMTIDVNTGRAAGIRTVAVATGSSTKKELKDLKPWKIIGKMLLLKPLLKELS